MIKSDDEVQGACAAFRRSKNTESTSVGSPGMSSARKERQHHPTEGEKTNNSGEKAMLTRRDGGPAESNDTITPNTALVRTGVDVNVAMDATIQQQEQGPTTRDVTSKDERPPPQPVDGSAPITYLYLTFDTPIPEPETATDAPRPPGDQIPPPAPDLSQYTNPLTWPKARKDMMVFLSCVATCLTAYTAGAYSPPAGLIAEEFGTTREAALVGVTTFCMGFALAPMILAPFSEINGRYPCFAIAGVIFTAFQAACGLVTNLAGILVARLIHGAGGSVFSTMVGGVIADMYEKEDRNTPMALFSGSVLFGTGLGPLVGSVMVQAWGHEGQKWKWIFWHQTIMDFVLMVAIVILFRESRGCVLLSRKAKALNRYYEELEKSGRFGVWMPNEGEKTGFVPESRRISIEENSDSEKRMPEPVARFQRGTSDLKLQRIRWLVKEDEQRGSIADMIRVSIFRPFHLLFTESIVFFFSLWVSFAWAVLYLTFGSVPLVFQRQYNFNTQQSGYVFVAMMVGSILATVIGIYQENILKHPGWKDGGSDDTEQGGLRAFIRRRLPIDSPEARLYPTCVTSIMLPLGLYLFGFSAQPSIHWIVPAIAIGISTMGIYYVYLAAFNYLADIYQTYASSSLAAQSFCRNVLGGVFPLVTTLLIQNLGEDAMGGLLGGIATVLTIVPWVLVAFGERIRRRSPFAVVRNFYFLTLLPP
ncbi:major facilitator superfamily domain-containing protein [Biscogniauxia mediterranea]|nr:major facilitator superfamily domain-containing protein [Biscogniauxia mediterranea]